MISMLYIPVTDVKMTYIGKVQKIPRIVQSVTMLWQGYNQL